MWHSLRGSGAGSEETDVGGWKDGDPCRGGAFGKTIACGYLECTLGKEVWRQKLNSVIRSVAAFGKALHKSDELRNYVVKDGSA